MAVAPLVLSSAKLTMIISAVKDSYKNAPTTLIATSTECKVMHMTLSKIQGLVYKNESDLSSRLTAQKPLREAFDDALTGCRMTLAALNLELDKLVEPKEGMQSMEFGFRAKARLVWREAAMKQLLDQTRGQMTSLQYLIQFLESETQADILKSLQKNLADIRRIFHRAKSIRLDQGIEDDQSSFQFTHQSVAFGLAPLYEAQLSQSSSYQRAQTAAAEELLARRIELMDEKYALEDRVEGLLLESNLKDETIRQLEHDVTTKEQRISILEYDILKFKTYQRAQATAAENLLAEKLELMDEKYVLEYRIKGLLLEIDSKDETARQLEHEILTKAQRISISKHDIPNSDRLLLNEQQIIELENETTQVGEVNDLNSNGTIHEAAKIGNAKVMGLLLSRGANIEAMDKEKKTLLNVAADRGHVEIVKMLLEKGANKEAADKLGWTPLHAANCAEIAKLLIEEGANKEAVNENGLTPLAQAASVTKVEVVRMLLEKGADKEVVNKTGQTPLIRAAFMNRFEIVQVLLEKGANKEAIAKSGRTPLLQAAYMGHVEMVKILLNNGANKEATTKDGQTPLALARRNGHENVAKLLIENGAMK